MLALRDISILVDVPREDKFADGGIKRPGRVARSGSLDVQTWKSEFFEMEILVHEDDMTSDIDSTRIWIQTLITMMIFAISNKNTRFQMKGKFV